MKTSRAFTLELCAALLLPFLSSPINGVVADDSAENAMDCKVESCMGNFDLSALRASTDYTFSHSHQNFTLNLCRGVVSELWNSKIENTERVGAFVRGAHGDLSIGEVNTTFHIRDNHPVLYLLNGSPCPQSSSNSDSPTLSSTAISFICDKSIEIGTPHLLASFPSEGDNACSYVLEWRTKHACAIPVSRSGWKALLTVIVIALSLLIALLALLFFQRRIALRRRSLSLSSSSYPSSSYPTGDHAWYTPTAFSSRLRDFGRAISGQDPWGDAPSHPPSSSNSDSLSTQGAGAGRMGRGWAPKFPKFGGLRLFGSSGGGGSARKPGGGGRGSGRGGVGRNARNGGFTRLPQSPEEEAAMMDNSDDDDEGEADITANGHGGGGGGVPPSLNEERAAWGAARPRGMDGGGVIRL
ncbi:mannose 6-phosphate receptor domain-containing protein [Schizopora paradoxa]|uniref:Mannose 6-phosphate receptor domain-containing protein n=1 Tax=Schizopora paradoxa TaxID=27342 RepID=A0A0H2RXX8_9AGAM|nr:mannose 6-phosphate receptor domain-containing protein [Schizopora paradoxa]